MFIKPERDNWQVGIITISSDDYYFEQSVISQKTPHTSIIIKFYGNSHAITLMITLSASLVIMLKAFSITQRLKQVENYKTKHPRQLVICCSIFTSFLCSLIAYLFLYPFVPFGTTKTSSICLFTEHLALSDWPVKRN